MKIEYDREVDALYIRIQEKDVYCTKEVDEGINLDLTAFTGIQYRATRVIPCNREVIHVS